MGLLLTGAILVAAVLQLTGLFDLAGALGLRGRSGPTEVEAAEPALQQAAPEVPVPSAQPPTQPEAEVTLSDDPRARASELIAQRREGVNPHAARIAALSSQAREAAGDGRIEEAIDLVNNALQFDRSNADLICLLADLHREAGSLGEADALAGECATLRASLMAPEAEP